MDFSPDVEESFPYPLSITRDAFTDSDFDPDTYLFKTHRFTSLESLLTDLSDLSKSLNGDLLDLVNNKYTNFIELGQSISSGLELIENVSYEVEKFNISVEQTAKDLDVSFATASAALRHKKRLNLLKNKLKLIVLLNEQCTSFETLLGLDVDQTSPEELVNKLNTLTTLYFSVVKIFLVLTDATLPLGTEIVSLHSGDHSSAVSLPSTVAGGEELCPLFDKTVKTKVVSLKFEFQLYTLELMTFAKKDPVKYSVLLLLLLQLSRITGDTLHIFKKEG